MSEDTNTPTSEQAGGTNIVAAVGSAEGTTVVGNESVAVTAPPLDITSQPEPHRGILERVKTLLEADFEKVKAWIEAEEAKL